MYTYNEIEKKTDIILNINLCQYYIDTAMKVLSSCLKSKGYN